MIELAKQGPLQQMRSPQYQARVTSVAKPEPDYLTQMKMSVADKAASSAMDRGEEFAKPYIDAGLSKGKDAIMGMFSPAKTGADAATLANIGTGGAGEGALIGNALAKGSTAGASSGMMAGLGTAMPYIGMGLLAGKAFGLFSKGGPVYAQEGQLVGPLALRKIRYKQDGGKIEVEATMGE